MLIPGHSAFLKSIWCSVRGPRHSLELIALQMFLNFLHFLHCKCFSLNWNCSNSVSFHAICLKFFLVRPLKISLRVLAFSELSGRLPIATFTKLVCFCKTVCTANVFHFQFSTFPTLFNVNNLLSNLDWPNLTRVVELVRDFFTTFSFTFRQFSLIRSPISLNQS